MTLQWTVVAVFLYIEIFVLAIMLLPWIRPRMWQKLFKSRLSKLLEGYSHIYAWAFVGVLLLLFFDAIREVRKYSAADENMERNLHTANADAVIHMRLFRAQRNLYISGFALFLNLIIKRMIGLISKEAQLEASSAAAMKQAQSASDAARKLMDEQGGAESKEVEALNATVDTLKKALTKTEKDRDAMKKQAENLQEEYDRLSDELNALQTSGGESKKDD